MRFVGVSCAIPKNKVLSTEAYARFPQKDVDRIIANIGIQSHTEAPPGMTASDLAIAAADPLLERLGWERQSVDAVVFVTQTPDNYTPASAHRIQHKLGLSERCFAFDMNLGCSAFTHGTIVLKGLMDSGAVRRGLLLCGDATAGTFRPRLTACTNQIELGNALLFGDSASACAFEAGGEEQVKGAVFGADGSGYDTIHVPAGGWRMPWSPTNLVPQEDEGEKRRPIDLRLDGPGVFSFTIRRVPPMFEEILRLASWSADQVDYFVLHQANKFMLEFLRKKMKLPAERVPLSIEEFGNTGGASIPLTLLTRVEAQLARPTKWIMMGFGVGLSWSAVALETQHIQAVPLVYL